MGGGQQLRDIGGVGSALEEEYRIKAGRQPPPEAYQAVFGKNLRDGGKNVISYEDMLVEHERPDLEITTDRDELARRKSAETYYTKADFQDPTSPLYLREGELMGTTEDFAGPMQKPIVEERSPELFAQDEEAWEANIRDWDWAARPEGPSGMNDYNQSNPYG